LSQFTHSLFAVYNRGCTFSRLCVTLPSTPTHLCNWLLPLRGPRAFIDVIGTTVCFVGQNLPPLGQLFVHALSEAFLQCCAVQVPANEDHFTHLQHRRCSVPSTTSVLLCRHLVVWVVHRPQPRGADSRTRFSPSGHGVAAGPKLMVSWTPWNTNFVSPCS
jgi:hypothetical protein